MVQKQEVRADRFKDVRIRMLVSIRGDIALIIRYMHVGLTRKIVTLKRKLTSAVSY